MAGLTPAAGPAALLLAAGHATRLGPLRDRYAKACLPVAGTTPLAFALAWLADAGVRECWINLHHRGLQVRAEAERRAPTRLRLHFLEEAELRGTGGTLLDLVAARGTLPELVVNAKVFSDCDLRPLLADPPGTLLLHPPSDLRDFGGLRFDAAGILLGLRSRGAPAREARAAAYTGACRPDPVWLPHLERAGARGVQPLCLVRNGLLPALAAGALARARLHHGYWTEVSTPERLATARVQLAAGAGRHADLRRTDA
ncbi:MAG TPA: NTP transferase domain-containing protein [Planctomycetota bacterium]